MSGRIADGLILQSADPDLIRWMVGQLRESAERSGRDPASSKVQAAAPAHVGPVDASRDHVRRLPEGVLGWLDRVPGTDRLALPVG